MQIKLNKLRNIDKEISIGFLVLKMIYIDKDSQIVKFRLMPRVLDHYKTSEPSPFEIFIRANRPNGWIYFIPADKTDLFEAFESLMILCMEPFDRDPLMNDIGSNDVRALIGPKNWRLCVSVGSSTRRWNPFQMNAFFSMSNNNNQYIGTTPAIVFTSTMNYFIENYHETWIIQWEAQ